MFTARPKVLAATLGVSMLSFAGVSSAQPIEGTLLFGGKSEYLDAEGNQTRSIPEAREINFLPLTGESSDNATLVGVEGDFTDTLSVSDTGQFNDLQFDPLFNVEGDYLWSFGDFEFELTDMDIVNQEETFLSLSGEGILSTTLEGYDDTAFEWSFSSDSTSNNAGRFAFSSTATSVAEVPEPSTIALFGLGLCGLALFRGRPNSDTATA